MAGRCWGLWLSQECCLFFFRVRRKASAGRLSPEDGKVSFLLCDSFKWTAQVPGQARDRLSVKYLLSLQAFVPVHVPYSLWCWWKMLELPLCPHKKRVFEAGSPEPGPDPYPEVLAFRGVEEEQSLARPGYRLMFLMSGLFIFKQGTLNLSAAML